MRLLALATLQKRFANLVNDSRLEGLPCILEMPKGKRDRDGRGWDLVNVETRKLQR